jgi:hypothetical protein
VALLVAACSGSDSRETTGPEAMGDESNDESSAPATTTFAATADHTESGMAQGAMCELPSGGYAAACNSCLAAQCCAPIEDCKSDAACGEQLRCIVECQDDENPAECSMACARDGVDARYVAYDDCSFVECLSTCWM